MALGLSQHDHTDMAHGGYGRGVAQMQDPIHNLQGQVFRGQPPDPVDDLEGCFGESPPTPWI